MISLKTRDRIAAGLYGCLVALTAVVVLWSMRQGWAVYKLRRAKNDRVDAALIAECTANLGDLREPPDPRLTAFAEHLLMHGGVAVVPGSGFGAPGHMRLSFACSMQTLEEALRRMEKTLRAAQAA